MNISQETIAKVEESLGPVSFFNRNNITEDLTTADELIIYYYNNGEYCGVKVKATKKETTFERVLQEVEKKKIKLPNDFRLFEPLAKLSGIAGFTCYGLSLCTISHQEKKEKQLDAFLGNLGINYSKEYSDAQWVMRYKISKSRENLARVAAIK